MSVKHFAAFLGFAFVAAWISFNFGYAILCLVGAGVFYAAASMLQGEIDLGELQSRFQGTERPSRSSAPYPPSPGARPAGPRVR